MDSPSYTLKKSPSKDHLKLAIIGGGLFSRDAHVPAILQLEDIIKVVAVWSKTKLAAERIAALFTKCVCFIFLSFLFFIVIE